MHIVKIYAWKDGYKMKKILVIGVFILFLLTTFSSNSTTGTKIIVKSQKQFDINEKVDERITMFIPGELIVKFKKDIKITKTNDNNILTGNSYIDSLNQHYGIKSVDKIFKSTEEPCLSNVYNFVLSENTDLLLAASKYSADSNVEYVEPNYIFQKCIIPNDEYFEEQWALNQLNDIDINAPEAWDIETGNENIVIAIIDSGVDYNHPDLKDNIWINYNEIPGNLIDDDNNGYIDDIIGWDFINNNNDPLDENGHGTHCAGIASAVTNNSIGVAGLSWGCKIMPLKILGNNGSGAVIHGAMAILYAIDNGANIISMSFGSLFYSKLFDDITNYAYNKGIILVAAAGNNNLKIKFYPAAYDNVLAVAATDQYDRKARFSNYGSWVDIASPGVDILSTMPTYNVSMNDAGYNKNYTKASGTSMACPYVAGLAGLLLSNNPGQNPDQIKSRIIYSADRTPPDREIGRGRINAYEALMRGLGPAESNISLPIHLSEVSGSIEIRGSASGEGFQYFTLEYGKGKNPDEESWIMLINSTSEVFNDLFTSLDTTLLDEGIYIIKLTVNCDNGFYKDKIRIIVNNDHNTIYVDDDGGPGIDFTSITEAVENCGAGDNIFVYNGTYIENIEIYISISLIGENKDTTIIAAKNKSLPCIYVNCNRVNISGFNLTNALGFFNHGGAILLDNSNYCEISYNNFLLNTIGIKLIRSSHNKIKMNIFNWNMIGARLILFSNFNEISKNNLFQVCLDYIQNTLLFVIPISIVGQGITGLLYLVIISI
jgi:parallel beta-helix repeat protein